MVTSKLLVFLLGVIFSLSLVSANGLLVNITGIDVNKTYGSNYPVIVQIINTEPYTFYNVSFENNPYIRMPIYERLESGQILTTTANVTSDISGQFRIKIKGYYITNIGSSDETHQINISSYETSLSPCDFTITQGDSVRWINQLVNQVSLRNRDTNLIFATLNNGDSYQMTFSTPETLRYFSTVAGFIFSTCDITALSSSGYVNDPNLDGILNLSVTVNFNPTSIATNFVATNFSTKFLSKTEGIMSIQNTGNQTARNIFLSGNWMSFSANNFSLNPGENKAIIFSISPLVTATDQTNKTYIQSIQISGNFPTLNYSISVFVEYANVNSNGTSQQDVDYLINIFCPQFPNSVLCNPEPKVIYKYIANGSDEEFNITMTQGQFKDLMIHILKQDEEITTTNNFMKMKIDTIETNLNASTSSLATLENVTTENSQSQESTQNNLLLLGIIVLSGLMLCTVGGLIFYYRIKNSEAELREW